MKSAGAFLFCMVMVGLAGCDWMPGRPKLADKRPEPAHITDFKVLFSQNCRGCHGDGTGPAGSISMNDPLYLSILPKEQLRHIVAKGIPGTRMPGFAVSDGGSLTEAQVDILVEGILAWATKPAPPNAPPYSSALGDPVRGAATFAVACGSCHGVDGTGVAGKAGSVVDPAYVGLSSDQYLRTIVIAGRSDLGCPDYLSRIPDRPMTNEEISDVTAWLVSQRKNEFGQPVPLTQRN